MTKVQGSPAYSLAVSDLKKIGLHVLIVASSAVVAYILTILPQIHLDNGIAMMLIPFLASGLEALQKFLTDTEAKIDVPPSDPPKPGPTISSQLP